MTSPCMNCAERAPGCHGRCERYQAYRESRDQAIRNRAQAMDTEQVVISSISRMKRHNPAKRKS